ncbi:MAG TPA: hypothetical protein VFA61_05445 [Candidatus Udaeobacter sp.]|nr:hypothetical protein [Candidatus Udaeobacter sp.]
MKINTSAILTALLLGCPGLCLKTRAVSPPPDGVVAEEVAKVNPDRVVRGEDGQPLGVRYEANKRYVAQ